MKWWSPTPWAVCEHQAWTFDVGWTPKLLQVVQVCLDPASVDGKTMHPLTLGYMTTLSGPILVSRTGKSMRDYLTLGYGYNYYILIFNITIYIYGIIRYNCTLIRYHEGCWFILTACTTDACQSVWYSMVFLRWAPWSQSFHLSAESTSRKLGNWTVPVPKLNINGNQVQLSQGLEIFDPSRIPTTLGRQSHNAGGFLPAVKQIGNVAALPGPLLPHRSTVTCVEATQDRH